MTQIRTRKSDVIWNYVGTIVAMLSGFILLPFLMRFLTDEELGLWYVYVAIANFALLFEFGFNPTFARNIVYVVSGARRLSSEGLDSDSVKPGIDWHLLNVVIRTSRLIYAGIAGVALLLLATVGTFYVAHITAGMDPATVWVSWLLFCVAIVLNLYFLYSVTILRGYGDVAGENQAKTFARLIQLATSAILLMMGFGLIGASIGYLVNSVLMRLFALIRMKRHAEYENERKTDRTPITRDELRNTFATVGHLAWRDGVVRFALYISTQAMSIMSSLFLGLAQTGMYSVLLQLATAIYNFAMAYPKSFFPAMQASHVSGNDEKKTQIISSGVVAYWALLILGTLGVLVVIMPLLPIFKPGVHVDYLLFLAMVLYLGLLNQHSIFCNYIISMNEIPYMLGYILASIAGIVLVWLFAGVLGWGAWGIVAGQALSQIVYNNWKWPQYLCRKIGTTYPALIRQGLTWWKNKLSSLRKSK